MVRYKVRPWRDHAELLIVRDALFSANAITTIPSCREACNTIEIWRRRLPLPHAISSTCFIVEAQLHRLQHGCITAPLAMRAMFASAIARFVTGFCDINQDKVTKRSMFDVAAELGMPEQWVELRHQITHGGELPGLTMLEKACEGAMSWLWEHYWARLDIEEPATRGQRIEQTKGLLGAELRTILKSFIKGRKMELSAQVRASPAPPSRALEDALSNLLPLVSDHPEGADIMISLFVDEPLLTPLRRSMGDSMAGAFRLWDELLTQLSLRIGGFLVLLALHMMDRLTTLDDIDETQDPSKEAIELWLEHIFTSRVWKARRARSKDGLRELRNAVLTECLLSPGRWTQQLSQRLMKSVVEPDLVEEWQEVCDAAALDDEMVDDVEATDVAFNGEDKATEEHVHESVVISRMGGWKVYPGRWRPLPIGVPQSAIIA